MQQSEFYNLNSYLSMQLYFSWRKSNFYVFFFLDIRFFRATGPLNMSREGFSQHEGPFFAMNLTLNPPFKQMKHLRIQYYLLRFNLSNEARYTVVIRFSGLVGGKKSVH